MAVRLADSTKSQINGLVFPNSKLYDYTLKCFVTLLISLNKDMHRIGKDELDKVIALYLSASKLRYSNPKLAVNALFAATMIVFEITKNKKEVPVAAAPDPPPPLPGGPPAGVPLDPAAAAAAAAAWHTVVNGWIGWGGAANWINVDGRGNLARNAVTEALTNPNRNTMYNATNLAFHATTVAAVGQIANAPGVGPARGAIHTVAVRLGADAGAGDAAAADTAAAAADTAAGAATNADTAAATAAAQAAVANSHRRRAALLRAMAATLHAAAAVLRPPPAVAAP